MCVIGLIKNQLILNYEKIDLNMDCIWVQCLPGMSTVASAFYFQLHPIKLSIPVGAADLAVCLVYYYQSSPESHNTH